MYTFFIFQCSVTCGSGVETRTVTCVDQNDITVQDTLCDNEGLAKPVTTRACTLAACGTIYTFVTGTYSEVS